MRISDWSSDVCSSDLLRVERDLADVVTQRNGVADIARIGRLRGEEQRDVAHRKEGGQDIGDRLLLRLRIEEGGIAAEDQAVGWRNRRLERSEEHTSELQSLMRISYAVFCLKKKTYT